MSKSEDSSVALNIYTILVLIVWSFKENFDDILDAFITPDLHISTRWLLIWWLSAKTRI